MSTEENIPQPQFEEIERYLQQQMSAEEERNFTERISQDPALQEQVNEMRLLIIGIEEASLQEQLNAYHEELPGSKIRWMNSAGWLAAASVAVIIVSALFWLTRSSRPEKLFAEYFVKEAGLVTSMGVSDNFVFEKAMVDYKVGKYDDAIRSWTSLPQSDTTNYFIASAYLAGNNTDSAVIFFKRVIEEGKSPFVEDASWYLGLALLKQDKPKEAIPYIKRSSRKEKEALLSKLTP